MKWILVCILFLLDHMECILFSFWAKERLRPSPSIYYYLAFITCAAQVVIVLSMFVCVPRRTFVDLFSRERATTENLIPRGPKEEEEVVKVKEGGITLKNKNHRCTRNTVWSSSISLSINHHGLSLKSVLFYKLFSWYLSFTTTHSSFYCYSNPQEENKTRQVITADHPHQNLL